MILGGIGAMVEVVERAHDLGLEVYVTDYLTDSPAKKVADKSFMISTTDVDSVIKLIKEEKIDGLYTGNVDLLLPYYAKICKGANLPCYGTLDHFNLMTDKKLFKKVCRENGVPVIKEYKQDDIERGSIEYPVIIKPVDSIGSKGISVCFNYDELHLGIQKALEFSPSKQYIVEKYMRGDEVVLYYYFQDGNPMFVIMCDRYVFKQREDLAQLPTAYIFPSKYTVSHLKETNEKIIQMFKNIGMQNGPIFLQAFIEDGIPYIYEPGYRTNGAREQYIINDVCGVSSVDMLLNFALTGKESDEDISKKLDPHLKGKYACKLSPLIGKGKIKRIDGLEKIYNHPFIVKTVLNNAVGDEIKDIHLGTLRQVAYRSFIVADTLDDLKNTIDFIQKNVIYYDENDKSMMLKEFDTSILKKYKEW